MSINIQKINNDIQLEPQEINHLVSKTQNSNNITFKNLNYKVTRKKEGKPLPIKVFIY